jgi:glutaredoxin
LFRDLGGCILRSAVDRRRAFLLIFVALTSLLSVLFSAGCRKQDAAPKQAPALPVVTDASTDLLLTWVDDKGEFHVEQKVADVPAAARETVRVTDPQKDPPGLDDVFVADLRTPGPNGAYPVKTASRAEFEKVAVARRQEHGKVLTAQSASPPPAATARPAVIIYGASWCGPCHQAADYLKQRGVAYVLKDIEQDGGAAREMHAKLASAGMRGGSIPVIDVRGKVMVGFDQGAVDRALSSTL